MAAERVGQGAAGDGVRGSVGIALSVVIAASFGPGLSSAAACRCEPLPLADYFRRAQVVMEVEVDAVDDLGPAPGVGAHRRAQVRVLRSYKSAAGVDGVRTEIGAEACGVTLEPGGRYWIFAQHRPADSDVWIGACDGSRVATAGFVDVEASAVAESLASLAGKVACDSPTPMEIASKMRLDRVPGGGDRLAGTRSPNRAYVFALANPTAMQRPPRVAVLTVDNEREERLRLSLHGVAEPVHAEWVNEKLVYVRVPWSRTLRTDLVLDVEDEVVLLADSARIDPNDGRVSWLGSDCSER